MLQRVRGFGPLRIAYPETNSGHWGETDIISKVFEAVSELGSDAGFVALGKKTAVMIRAGSRALRMTTTASGRAPLKYGSTKSSRRTFGASTTGMFRFSDQLFS